MLFAFTIDTKRNILRAQSGTDYFSCSEHPDQCGGGQVGCQGGLLDITCMINCPPYSGAPWVLCSGGSTDPNEHP